MVVAVEMVVGLVDCGVGGCSGRYGVVVVGCGGYGMGVLVVGCGSYGVVVVG